MFEDKFEASTVFQYKCASADLFRNFSQLSVRQSGATKGTGRNSPPTPHRGHVCKSSETDEKIWGMGGDVTNHILISA